MVILFTEKGNRFSFFRHSAWDLLQKAVAILFQPLSNRSDLEIKIFLTNSDKAPQSKYKAGY